jgi:hypothetical protein
MGSDAFGSGDARAATSELAESYGVVGGSARRMAGADGDLGVVGDRGVVGVLGVIGAGLAGVANPVASTIGRVPFESVCSAAVAPGRRPSSAVGLGGRTRSRPERA